MTDRGIEIVGIKGKTHHTARLHDCIYLTHVGNRYAPVHRRTAGTVTAREGELGVVVQDTQAENREEEE